MKCEACGKFKLGGIGLRTWGGSGCSTIQLLAVKQHEKSDDHKWSCQRWFAKHHLSSKGHVAPIELGIQTMVDRKKEKIVTVIKLLLISHYLLTLTSANFTRTWLLPTCHIPLSIHRMQM